MSATGQLVLVVGPSGAGKDTLIDAARARRPDIRLPRRWITRPESAGGEPFRGVTDTEFTAADIAGQFAFTWAAHDLRYGIPAKIQDQLDQGFVVLFNASRGIIPDARARFAPNLHILVVTASSETLATRLAARGRETADDIARRLARASYAMPEGPDVTVIWNDGTLEDSVGAFLAALPPQPVNA